MILRVQYSCESMKIHGNGVNICVFFVHFTDHQSVIYVPCPRSGHPTRASNSFKKGCKNPSFVQSLVQNKKQQQKIEFKGRRRGQNKVGSLLSVKVKCLFYCYLFTNPRDLDKKLWVAQCQSHLNITENWWVAATKIPCTTFWKKSGQPFSAVIFGVLESFFIYFTTANDITERKYSTEGE